MIKAREAVAFCAGAGTIAGLIYNAFALSQMRRLRRDVTMTPRSLDVPVTILKPLLGDEPRLYENLASFCRQNYPRYQIIFGAADPNDPALSVARTVARDHPGCDIAIVSGRARPAANPKVGNLLGMMPLVKHPLIIVADSDICVDPRYLAAVTAVFTDTQTGAVTCLYGARPHQSVASQLGALFVNDTFAPSALVAQAIEPLTYCFGATIAVRATVLEAIGGFESLREFIGDDYMLGRLVSQAGYRVRLAPYVVQTDSAEPGLRALWTHELRWARTIRAQRPLGYFGSVITNVLPFAIMYAALAPPLAGLAAVTAAATMRIVVHKSARKTFAPTTRAALWLLPVRDVLNIGVWCAGMSGRAVTWRTSEYRVQPGGRMA